MLEFGLLIKLQDFFSGPMRKIEGAMATFQKSVKAAKGLSEIGSSMIGAGAPILGMGLAIGYGLKKALDSAAEVNEAMTHLSTTLDSGTAGVREYAQSQADAEAMSVKFNYAQKDIIDNLYRSVSFLGNYDTALAVTNASLAVARGNMGDAAMTGQTLATVYNDFGDKTKNAVAQVGHFADLTAYISRHGAFHSVDELNSALGESIGAAKAAGMSYEDTIATLNAFKAVGVQPGTALAESLAAFARHKLDVGNALVTFKNGALDVIGTFVKLRQEVGSGAITLQQFERYSKALGIRGERALTVNTDDLLAMQKALHDPTLINGAALQGATTMMSAFNNQIGALGKRFEVLGDLIGGPLMAPLTKLASMFGKILDYVTDFAKHHATFTKWAVAFTSVAAISAILVGGLLVLGGGLLMVSASFGIATASAALFWSAALIGIPVLIAGIAAGAYEIYKHWGPIKAWFAEQWGEITTTATHAWATITSVWGSIGAWFTGQWGQITTAASTAWALIAGLPGKIFGKWMPEFFDWGAKLLKTFAEGIWSAFNWPLDAMKSLVGRIAKYLPHLSPAEIGPLSTLDRLPFSETFALSMKPAPVIDAMRRLAAAAVFEPMHVVHSLPTMSAALGMPTMGISSPAMVSPVRPEMLPAPRSGGRTEAGGSIVIHYSPNITVNGASGSPEDWVKAMRQHGDDVVRLVEDKLSRRDRLRYD
jgi:TP901 family phage tail tape measure protein